MKKSLLITGVRVIPANAKVARPLVIFSVQGHDDIVLAPNQALIGLQNSGRALGVTDAMSADAQQAYRETIGAIVTADISYHKAGEFYVIDENHPAITGKTPHELAGQVKIGDKVAYKEDGMRIEGFIDIPYTQAELMRRDISKEVAKGFMSMFGVQSFAIPSATSSATPVIEGAQAEPPFEPISEPATEPATAESEAFGKPARRTK
jgi:hypothetical protein